MVSEFPWVSDPFVNMVKTMDSLLRKKKNAATKFLNSFNLFSLPPKFPDAPGKERFFKYLHYKN